LGGCAVGDIAGHGVDRYYMTSDPRVWVEFRGGQQIMSRGADTLETNVEWYISNDTAYAYDVRFSQLFIFTKEQL
jgi:hypothetical protein